MHAPHTGSPYRANRCAACDGAMDAPCRCRRCEADVHAECRRVRRHALQRELRCPKCDALMAREGGEQALVLGVLLAALTWLAFGGAITRRDHGGGSGGGYGQP